MVSSAPWRGIAAGIAGRRTWPRQWLVAAWMPRPVAGMNASMVVVYSPPANFSFSDLTPGMVGTASRSSYTLW